MKLHNIAKSIAILAFSVAAQAQDLAQADKPEAKVGDLRIYSVLDPYSKVEQRVEELIVTEITDEKIVITDKVSSISATYDRDWAYKQVGSRVFTSPVKALSFPLLVGKKWEHSSSYKHPLCGNSSTTQQNEVVGWEDVTVAAGTFRALRIESTGNWKNNCGSDKVTNKFWYAPKAKWIVKSESITYVGGRVSENQLRELKSFQLVE